MNPRQRFLIAVILAATLGAGCGEEQSAADLATSDYLRSGYDAIGVGRSSAPRTFVGQKLWEYINGGAELYHQYSFVEVATANYKKGETEMVVDLYRFDSPVNAFGLYSMLRPEEASLARYGVEGHISPSKVEFVKGDILTRVIGYDETDETSLALINLADEINKQLPGEERMPATFERFPSNHAAVGTARYFAEAFLGQGFLTKVYCQDYQLDTAKVTLFLCEQEPGAKLLEWSALAEGLGTFIEVPDGLPFDDGKAFAFDNSFYGRIVVGIRTGRMAGIVGYSDSHREFLSDWLEGMK